MKIFVISGKVNGMAKLAGKLQFSGCDYSDVQDVVLFDGDNIKVIEKSNIASQILEDKYIGIVLVANDKRVLGVGSSCGKIDVQKIMIKYNLFDEKRNRSVQTKQNSSQKKDSQKNENFANNTLKIDSNLKKGDCFEQNSDCQNSNKKVTGENDCKACESVGSDVKKEFDFAYFANVDLQDDNIVDTTETKEKDCKAISEGDCDIDEDIFGEQQSFFDADVVKNTQTEVVISKDEDIIKGVDFVVEQLKSSTIKKNYYAEIKADLDNFLRSYPKNEELECKVFGSKWVKITADYDYSVGVIFEEDKPTIIAYAEPYDDKTLVNASKLQLGEWLQIEEKGLKNRGYFIFYQNAETGQMILNTGF